MANRKFLISVIGGHKCDGRIAALAEEIGKVVANEGAVLVCGGLKGIMEAAAKGAKEAGGLTIGIIPGDDKTSANQFIDIVIPSGMGMTRNTLVAGVSDMVVALPGEYGTLSEIAFALIGRKPVYGFEAWDIKGVIQLKDTEELRNILKLEITNYK